MSSSSEKDAKAGGRRVVRATVPGAQVVSYDENHEPLVDSRVELEASTSLGEPDLPSISSLARKDSAASSGSFPSSSKGKRKNSVPATIPVAESVMLDESASSPHSTGSKVATVDESYRSRAEDGSVSATATAPMLNRAPKEIEEGERDRAPPAVLQRIRSVDTSEGADAIDVPTRYPGVLSLDAPSASSGTNGTLVRVDSAESKSWVAVSSDSTSKENRLRCDEPSVPGAHRVRPSQDTQDSVAVSKDPRMRSTPSNCQSDGHNSPSPMAIEESMPEDCRSQHADTSVPGAHHVFNTMESNDSVASAKDPRQRHEGQRGRAQTSKSRATDSTPVVVLGGDRDVMNNELHAAPGSQRINGQDDKESLKTYEADVKEIKPEASMSANGTVLSGLDLIPAYPFDDVKDPFFEDPRKNVIDPEQPAFGPNSIHNPAAAAALTTEARGIGAPPDVTYGTTGHGGIPNDDDLAIALAVEDDEGERFLPAAVEFDPDSKPPLLQNRRFRLYICSAIILFFVVIISVTVGVVVSKQSPPGYGSSQAPSFAPTSFSDALYFQQFALVQGNEEWSYTRDSPQARAARWIMDEDERRLDAEAETLTQRYLLAVFYYATTQNGALSWPSCNPNIADPTDTACEFYEFTRQENDAVAYFPKPSTRWLSKEDECKWAGVVCDELFNVHAIELIGQNISGTIPTELAAFPYIQSIALAYNKFTGTLPITFALPDMARHLLNVEFHGNLLTGTIPSDYYKATGLQNLNIGDNFFTGTVSTDIGSLTNLKGLHMFQNMLTGTIPTEIENLNYLSFVRLSENIFTGTIPTEFGEFILLEELWLSSNHFTGLIPTEFGLLNEMTDLLLNWNMLTGTIPTQLYDLTHLTRLDLFSNYLNGTIATEIGLLTELKQLRLSRAELSGTVPVQIANLTKLMLGWFHSNRFIGSIPSEICDLTKSTLKILQSDCFPEEASPNPCRCCTACCNRDTEICLVLDSDIAP